MDPAALLDPFQAFYVPLAEWANDFIRWLMRGYGGFFRALKAPVQSALALVENGLRAAPQSLVVLCLTVVGWQAGGARTGLVAFLAMTGIGLIGAWQPAMTSLAILFCAVSLAVAVGLPIGVVCSRSNFAWGAVRPVLDLMQTIPSFTYLVPVVLLLGIGNVPGIIVTAFYAVPPLIRLTNLGLREVRSDLVEAADAFGASPWRRLWAIELPLARPMIMAGLNQTVMLSLAMSVIASMISVAGLGRLVLVGITQLDMARASVGGLGIVLLAVAFDRIMHGLGATRRQRGGRGLLEGGPVGWLRSLRAKGRTT